MTRNKCFNRIKKENEWNRNIGAKERMALDTNVMVVETQQPCEWEKDGEDKNFRRGEEI